MSQLPSVPGVTCDEPTSSDLDDAIWLEVDDSGYILTVSVTAVSRRVTPSSPTDSDAQQAAFTRYFANSQHKPMLSTRLEEELSLLPGKRRWVLAMTLRYSPTGELLEASDPVLAMLDNRGRYSYEEVADLVAGAEGPHAGMFRQASILAGLLLDRRRSAGALVFYDLRRGWETTEEGLFRKTRDYEANIGHIIIQEFMVASCAAMGEFGARNKIGLLFRNHQAGFATPDRDFLLSHLVKAVSMPVENLQALRARFTLVLERAEVGPWVLGHYGLNVPVYAQWTSPLRRYTDLVNHRQVIAFLEGQPPPYTQAELGAIAAVVNEVERQIRESSAATTSKLVAGASNTTPESLAAQQLTEVQLQDLAPDKLYKRLIATAKQRSLPLDLIAELEQRFEAGMLGARELFALLLVAPPSPEAEPLRIRALDQLARVPVAAPSILVMAASQLGYGVVSYTSQKKGPEHQLKFSITAKVTAPGKGQIESAVFSAFTSKVGSQRAAVDLIGIVAGYRPQGQPSSDMAASPPAAATSGNWKGALNQLCQLHGWGSPQYAEVERTGPPHAPQITSSVVVETTNGFKSSTGGPAGSKKQAEQLAAQRLFEELEPSSPGESTAAEPFVASVEEGNYIGALGETCRTRRWREPQYFFELKRDVHTCRCVVVANNGISLESAAHARTKGEAKRQAARRIYLALLSAA